MIEEGIAFSANVPYPENSNGERRRVTRRKIHLQLGEFGAEQIQISPSELDEIRSPEKRQDIFHVRGFSPGSTNGIDTIIKILKQARASNIEQLPCSIKRRII